jgi:predicted dehydrogenase
MQNSQLRFGVVGTGMIAGVIADAIDKSTNAKLIAVSSRQIDTAQSFVGKRQGVVAVQGLDDLLARADVDAVYIAIPTAGRFFVVTSRDCAFWLLQTQSSGFRASLAALVSATHG